MKIAEIFNMVEKSSQTRNEELQTLAIIQEISYSNLETRRYSPKSGVSRIKQESWQHYKWQFSLSFHSTMSIHNLEKMLWEFMKWSPDGKSFDQ